eukprot:7230845-Prorocentrum_lima.AAC.1
MCVMHTPLAWHPAINGSLMNSLPLSDYLNSKASSQWSHNWSQIYWSEDCLGNICLFLDRHHPRNQYTLTSSLDPVSHDEQ